MPEELLRALLTPAPALSFKDPAAWWADHRARSLPFPRAIDRAIAAGLVADRLAWPFAGGYAEALGALVPGQAPGTLAALAVTETGGNHPRAIETILEPRPSGYDLSGDKRWVTLGPTGGVFLVAARLPGEGARPQLKVVRVPSDAAGVTIEPLADLPFVPEIPHAALHLRQVLVPAEWVLPGDGYDAYVKPFRTVEDLYVHAAVLAYLLAHAGRSAWPTPWRERLLALLLATRAAAELDRGAPTTHLVVAGILSEVTILISEAEDWWQGEAGERWRRDRVLFKVASSARARRRENAWNVLNGPTQTPPDALD